MCDYGDYEPITFLTNRDVKTRTTHRCNCCRQKWPAGSTMRRWSGVVEGEFQDGYTCYVCTFMWHEPEHSKYHGCWLTDSPEDGDETFNWRLPLWQEVRALLAERDAIHALV